MNDPKKVEKLRRQGWAKMEVILVQRMQVSGSKFPWTWVITSVILILVVAIALYTWKGNTSGPSSLEVEETPLLPTIGKDSTKILAVEGADSSIRTYREVDPSAGRKEFLDRKKMDDRMESERFERIEKDFPILRRDSIENNSEKMDMKGSYSETEVENAVESPILAPDLIEKRVSGSGHEISKKIPTLYFNSDPELSDIANWAFEIIPIKPLRKNRIRFLAFAQSYGSPRDRFMYLQFGPGIYYSTANWDFSLKAGPSISIPKNKHFTYFNSRFGDRYYPGYFGDDLHYSIEILQENIYHMSYESKIGAVLSGSVGYHFHSRWNLSLEASFVMSSYNLLVEAHSNPFFTTYSYLTGKSNDHFYSGLKLGYSLNRNLTLQTGITGLNLNKRKERTILPAVAIQFRF